MDVFQEAEMLRRVPFFGGLDSAKLKLLAFTSRALKFAPCRLTIDFDVVFDGGEVSDHRLRHQLRIAYHGCQSLRAESGLRSAGGVADRHRRRDLREHVFLGGETVRALDAVASGARPG